MVEGLSTSVARYRTLFGGRGMGCLGVGRLVLNGPFSSRYPDILYRALGAKRNGRLILPRVGARITARSLTLL